MQIHQITNKEQWETFVGKQKQAQFAQSWDWADFQSRQIGQIWRFAVVEDGKLLASAKLIKKSLFLGRSYFYCDRGPIFKNNTWQPELGKLLFDECAKLAQKEKAIFLRLDPVFDLASVQIRFEKTIDIQPKKTAILDLLLDEEALLKAMHQKTRYNIRLAQKKGVEVVEAGLDRFEEFWHLMQETRERDTFSLHDKSYYRAMIGLPFIKMYFACHQNEVIAASIVASYGDTATYVHGCSGNSKRELMAPFLLQWVAIIEAKNAGYKYYDFYGVDEVKWPGVTRFKMGFAPEVIEYSGTYDLVYKNLWYSVYKVLRILRRKL